MLTGPQYYSAFVLSYLRNSLYNLRACQMMEGRHGLPGNMARESAVTSIIFSAMTLEAFCNYCFAGLVASLTKAGCTDIVIEQLTAYFERLSIQDKWKELFKHKDSNFIATIPDDWNLYLELVKLRNLLVHSRGQGTVSYFASIDSLGSEDAKKALGIVNHMMTHGIRMFSDLIPSETYDPGTFEPTLTRPYPVERIRLSEILAEPFAATEAGVRPFMGIGPREYREAFMMQNLIPPENFPWFEVTPLFYSSASNDGLASFKLVGYTWDESMFNVLAPPV